MAATNPAQIAALLAKAKTRNEEVKKEGFKTSFYALNKIADGQTIEIKLLLPEEGQQLFSEVLFVQTGEKATFRSNISQNFPFSPDGSCVLVDALEAAAADPDTKAQHATILDSVRRVKKLVYPCLICTVETDATGEVTNYSVLDNEVKFLELTPNQSTDLLSIIDSRGAKNATGAGVYAFNEGKLISITRTGKGQFDTKYKFALSEPLKWKKTDETKFSAPVDVEGYIKSQILDDDKMNEFIVKLFS